MMALEIIEGCPQEGLVSTVKDEIPNPVDSGREGVQDWRLYECDREEVEDSDGLDNPEL